MHLLYEKQWSFVGVTHTGILHLLHKCKFIPGFQKIVSLKKISQITLFVLTMYHALILWVMQCTLL